MYSGKKLYAVIFLIQFATVCFSQKPLETLEDVKKAYPGLTQYNEATINYLGYRLVKQNRLDEAVEIFRFNLKTHPESWNAYDSLAEAYMIKGESDLAVLNYEKSLELNPGNANGKRMLEKLKNPLLAELTGDYEFYFKEKYILLEVYIEEGKLMGVEPPDDPIEMMPLDPAKLKFKAEEEEHDYYITFMKNEDGNISKIRWVDGDLTIYAVRIEDRNFKTVFPVEELQEDFRQARRALEEKHAALYEYTDKKTFDELFDKQYGLITRPMNLREFFRILTPVTARIGCAHTNVWMPSAYWNSDPHKLFPLRIRLIEGKAVVTGDYDVESSVPLGSIILDINGVPVADIIEEMKQNYSADAFNENFILSQIERRFSMIYARRFGFPETFRTSYIPPGEERGITDDLKPAGIQAVRAVVFANHHHPELEFELHEDKNTAVMTIKTFIYYDRVPMFKEYLERSFREIREKEIKNLILDIRGNDGGDPFCAAPLLSYLEREPVPYFAEPYGKYSSLADPITLAENHFTGNLYILIDGRCNSTSGHFCSLLKYHKLGKFVGSEGGASYKCNAGQDMHMDLKNTRIMLYIGKKTYAAAVEGIDKRRGVSPDYPVTQTYSDLLEGKDTVFQHALALIENSCHISTVSP